MKRIIFVILALCATALSPTAAGDTYYVSVWNGNGTCGGATPCLFNADQADAPVPGTAPLGTFEFVPNDDLTGISWATGTGAFNTYGDFLDNGQIDEFSGTVDLATFLATPMSLEGNSIASFFTVSGVYNSESAFSTVILHVDGASLYVDDANVFRAPGRVTGQATAGPYDFLAGTHAFTLYYVAADGGPPFSTLHCPTWERQCLSRLRSPCSALLCLCRRSFAPVARVSARFKPRTGRR